MNNVEIQLERELEALREKDHFRTLQKESSQVDFTSNDYLGIGRAHPDLNRLEGLLAGSMGSRLLSGNRNIHEDFEREYSSFVGADAGLLFPSGYQANLAVLSTLLSRHDTVHFDELVHASIRDGLRIGLAKAVKYPHQDYEVLEANLKKGGGTQFVVTEALFSMDGDLCQLKKLAELCDNYDAQLILDEAHSTGLFGDQGKGLANEMGVSPFVKIMTFGKAIGRMGAMVVGSNVLRDYMINKARPFVYSTAPSPIMVELIKEGVEQAAARKGIDEIVSLRKSIVKDDRRSPIVPIVIPGNDAVRAKAHELSKAGFDVRPILSPTVPEGQERIRVALHSFNSLEDVEGLAGLL